MAADDGIGTFLIEFVRRFDRGIPEALKAVALDVKTDILTALTTITGRIDATATQQSEVLRKIGDVMKVVDELGKRIDANTETANKALAEIRSALDKALQTQVTPEELAAAVADAKASQKIEDEAAFDAALAPITDKVNAQAEALKSLDDIVPDAPAEPAPSGEPVPATPAEPVTEPASDGEPQ